MDARPGVIYDKFVLDFQVLSTSSEFELIESLGICCGKFWILKRDLITLAFWTPENLFVWTATKAINVAIFGLFLEAEVVKTGMMGVAGFRLEPMGVSMAQKSKNEFPKIFFKLLPSLSSLALQSAQKHTWTASTVYQRVERLLCTDHLRKVC